MFHSIYLFVLSVEQLGQSSDRQAGSGPTDHPTVLTASRDRFTSAEVDSSSAPGSVPVRRISGRLVDLGRRDQMRYPCFDLDRARSPVHFPGYCHGARRALTSGQFWRRLGCIASGFCPAVMGDLHHLPGVVGGAKYPSGTALMYSVCSRSVGSSRLIFSSVSAAWVVRSGWTCAVPASLPHAVRPSRAAATSPMKINFLTIFLLRITYFVMAYSTNYDKGRFLLG